MLTLALLSLFAGAAIAVQAAINTKLGLLLDNTLFATTVAFFIAFLTVLILFLATGRQVNFNQIVHLSDYLLVAGGVISALGVGLLYYLIPKLGVSTVMSIALTSQLICAMTISHFGWLTLPQKSIQTENALGALLMIVGLILVNWKSS